MTLFQTMLARIKQGSRPLRGYKVMVDSDCFFIEKDKITEDININPEVAFRELLKALGAKVEEV